MSFVIAAPEALDSAATDLVVLGSTLGAATAAAAAQTSTAYSGDPAGRADTAVAAGPAVADQPTGA
ncbi:PE domain-containing protein, partial [Mycobacterium tuberculosis]